MDTHCVQMRGAVSQQVNSLSFCSSLPFQLNLQYSLTLIPETLQIKQIIMLCTNAATTKTFSEGKSNENSTADFTMNLSQLAADGLTVFVLEISPKCTFIYANDTLLS